MGAKVGTELPAHRDVKSAKEQELPGMLGRSCAGTEKPKKRLIVQATWSSA